MDGGKKTDKNGKSYDDKELDDQVIGSGTLKEGFHIRIKDQKSDEYEVIIKVKDDRLLAGLAGIVTGSTKVGDVYVKDLTINLQKTMYLTAHEITATKSANNRGVITYGFAVKAASPATATVTESKVEPVAVEKVEVEPVAVESAKNEIKETPVENKKAAIDEIELFKIIRNQDLAYFLPFAMNVKTDWAKLGLRGNVKTMEYSANNWDYRYSFDENGKLTELRSTPSGMPPQIRRYEYKNGLLTRVVWGDQIETFEYDEKGNPKQYAEYDQSGALLKYGDFSFDPDGRIASFGWAPRQKNLQYRPDGTCEKMTYREDGYDEDIDYAIEYIYNAKKDVEMEKVTETGVFSGPAKANRYTIKYTYVYDAQGNWTKRTAMGDGWNRPETLQRKIAYY